MQTHVVFLGLPGSGKTMQADLLSRNFGMDIINTGTLILYPYPSSESDNETIQWAISSVVEKKLER